MAPTAALAMLGLAVAMPSAVRAQSKDHTWTPPVYELRGFVPGGPTQPVPGPQIAPTAPQLVERDGAASFQTPGDARFTVPEYTVITFMVNGGGGSAARPVVPIGQNPTRYDPDFGTPGYDGESSTLANFGMVGGGGGFGNGVTAIYKGCSYPGCRPPYPYDTIRGADSVTMTFYRGVDGGASGGDVNTTGGAGNGGAPTEAGGGNGGGNGGRAMRLFRKGQPGAPTPGTTITIHVGAGGAPAVVTEPMKLKGMTTKPGGDGSVFVNWKYLSY